MMCRPTSSIVPQPEVCASLSVEAFGSGAVIVPRFEFDALTTQIGELFTRVWAFYDKDVDRQSCFLRLLCGEEDDVISLEEKTQLLADVFDVQRHCIVYVVVCPRPNALHCLLPLVCQTNFEEWRSFAYRKTLQPLGWTSNCPLSQWRGVGVEDDDGNEVRGSAYNNKVTRLILYDHNVKGT